MGYEQKLYYLAGLMCLRVLALAKRPRDADVEAKGQKPIDVEAKSHPSAKIRKSKRFV